MSAVVPMNSAWLLISPPMHTLHAQARLGANKIKAEIRAARVRYMVRSPGLQVDLNIQHWPDTHDEVPEELGALEAAVHQLTALEQHDGAAQH